MPNWKDSIGKPAPASMISATPKLLSTSMRPKKYWSILPDVGRLFRDGWSPPSSITRPASCSGPATSSNPPITFRRSYLTSMISWKESRNFHQQGNSSQIPLLIWRGKWHLLSIISASARLLRIRKIMNLLWNLQGLLSTYSNNFLLRSIPLKSQWKNKR